MDISAFDESHDSPHQALIWRLGNIPQDFELLSIEVFDVDADLRLGECAVLWQIQTDSEEEASAITDALRGALGAVAMLVGSTSSATSFFVMALIQSQIGEYRDTVLERLNEQVGGHGWNDDSGAVVTMGRVAQHMLGTYRDCPGRSILEDPSGPSLRVALEGLVGEALGVPLPRLMTSSEMCPLPLWEHDCQGSVFADAVTCWEQGVVESERFGWLYERERVWFLRAPSNREPIVTRLTADKAVVVGWPEYWPNDGSFLARFAAMLGDPRDAPQGIDVLFDYARSADAHSDADTEEGDAAVLNDLESATEAADALLASDVPSGYANGLAQLAHELRAIFT